MKIALTKWSQSMNIIFCLLILITVDEVNNADHDLLNEAKKYDLQIMPTMPLIWASTINQYEFNDACNPAFELFKLLSFCKYAYDKYKIYLRELVNKYGFANISQFVSSFHQLVKATMTYQPNDFLRKLYFITPKENEKHSHLESLSITNTENNHVLSFDDLRKFPLYKTEKRGFMVIDENMYVKKMYRGCLFELNKETGLSKEIGFEDYKKDISQKCFEEILFKGIVRQLIQEETSVIHFDTNNENAEPDLYFRYQNDVFLIEFKDYLFPDTIIKATNFGKYKKYIHERFILSEREKKKGISQLINCISNLFDKKYEFDSEVNEKINKGERINVHPIICHTDFMFSMPGLNEYLNALFFKQLKEKKLAIAGIDFVTLINLEVLFDLALRNGNFMKLLSFIKSYYNTIGSMRQKSAVTLSSDDFIPSTASFDEMYKTTFRNKMIDDEELTDKNRTIRMTSIIVITQEQIDEIL